MVMKLVFWKKISQYINGILSHVKVDFIVKKIENICYGKDWQQT